jgi:hypothetical protein
MASRNSYQCFVCKKNGFADVMLFLDGKTADGKTIYKNEDMSPHVHKRQQQQQGNSEPQSAEQRSSVLEKVAEESIQKGITAQKKFEDLVLTVEGMSNDVNATRTSLEKFEDKVNHIAELLESQNRMIALLLDPQQRHKLTEYEREQGK